MSSLPRRMPSKGPVAERWEAWRLKSRRTVVARVRRDQRGNCEAGCGRVATDWAHMAGRRNIVAEPWASTPELTMGLCRDCHNAVDRGLDADLLARLRWLAHDRLAASYAPSEGWERLARITYPEPLDAIRRLVDHLTERGVDPTQ